MEGKVTLQEEISSEQSDKSDSDTSTSAKANYNEKDTSNVQVVSLEGMPLKVGIYPVHYCRKKY